MVGHSDPKITERRYSHFRPDVMSAEVNRLRFGLPALAPKLPHPDPHAGAAQNSLELAVDGRGLCAILVQPGDEHQKGGRDTRKKTLEVPAAELARDTGFEPVAFGSGGRRSIQLS